MTNQQARLLRADSGSLSTHRARALGLRLGLLALASAGCGPMADVRLSGKVVVPAELTTGFSADSPGAVVLETWAENATVPGLQWNLGVLCEPSATPVMLAFEHVVNLEEAGCPSPKTVRARLVAVPAGSPPGCAGARALPIEQLAALPPLASGHVKVFEERDGKPYCAGYADDYRAHAEITLTR